MERVMYNTVLGALPMQPDGRAFYYSDCYSGSAANDAGSQAASVGAMKVYAIHRWPCCAGTLPQVAADYWINGYFREPGAVWVNLYLPSVLRWTGGGSAPEPRDILFLWEVCRRLIARCATRLSKGSAGELLSCDARLCGKAAHGGGLERASV